MNQTRWDGTVRSNHVVVTVATANGGVAVAVVVGGEWVTWGVLVLGCPIHLQTLDLIDLPVKMRCSFQDGKDFRMERSTKRSVRGRVS